MTEEQVQVVDWISYKSGIDSWLMIMKNPRGEYEAYDLAERHYVPMKKAIEYVVEGMTSYEDYGLTERQIEVFGDLLRDLEIDNPFK